MNDETTLTAKELFDLEYAIANIIAKKTKGNPPYAEIVIEIRKRFNNLYSEHDIDMSEYRVDLNPDFGDNETIQFDFG